MAIIIARQKMVVRRAEGDHTIYPSAQQQSLPDHLLDHPHVKGAIASKWIEVQQVETEPNSEPEPIKTHEDESAGGRRRRRNT
jgi:hypothetical protein